MNKNVAHSEHETLFLKPTGPEGRWIQVEYAVGMDEIVGLSLVQQRVHLPMTPV